MSIQVNSMDHPTLVFALHDQVPEVFEGNVALSADFEGLVTAGAELLDRPLQGNLEIIGGYAQGFPHGARDPVAVLVDIVHGVKLLGYLGVQPVRKRVWDLVQDIIRSCGGYG